MMKPLAKTRLQSKQLIWTIIFGTVLLMSWADSHPETAKGTLLPVAGATVTESPYLPTPHTDAAAGELDRLLTLYGLSGYQYLPVECLEASKGTSPRYVNLKWYEMQGAYIYLILRRGDDGRWEPLEDNWTNIGYNDSDARLGKIYEYCVYALVPDKQRFIPQMEAARPERPQDYGYKQFRMRAENRPAPARSNSDKGKVEQLPRIHIDAVDPIGASGPAAAPLLSLAAPQAAAQLQTDTNGQRVIRLSWSALAAADWYEVQLLGKGEGSEAGALRCLLSGCSVTVRENNFDWQLPSKAGYYYLGVKARSAEGESPYSDWYLVTVGDELAHDRPPVSVEALADPWKQETPGFVSGETGRLANGPAAALTPSPTAGNDQRLPASRDDDFFQARTPIRINTTARVGERLRLEIPDTDIPEVIDSVVWSAFGATVKLPAPDRRRTSLEFTVPYTMEVGSRVHLASGRVRSYLFRVEAVAPTRFPVRAPSSFAPGPEGKGEVFYLRANPSAEPQLITFFRIRDLQNELIYACERAVPGDRRIGWNGHKNGRLLPAGAYLYEAELLDGDGYRQQLSGVVKLQHSNFAE